MSMLEDRKNAAANNIMHCEKMYRETRNPFFVLDALAASRWGEFTPPEWALEELLHAVEQAVRSNHKQPGDRLSIDAALGLTLSRGKTPVERRAKQLSREERIFYRIRTLHACFDISIPQACEIAYFSPDSSFAREWEEYGSEQWINTLDEPEELKKKLRSKKPWSISYGDRVGYGLENLIDRYYRAGTKQGGNVKKLRAELPPYTWDEKRFAKQLPKVRELITSGKKTAEDLILLLRGKGRLTETQEAQIRGEAEKRTPDTTKLRLFYEGRVLLNEIPETSKLKMRPDFAQLMDKLSML
jgi:hypothetical protein